MNNTVPFFIPNGYIPNNYPNVNSMQNESIMNLENRVNALEKEVSHLKNRLNMLENKNNDNYSYTYQANSYNMM